MREIIYGYHAIKSLLKYNPSFFIKVYFLENYKNFKFNLIFKIFKKLNITVGITNRKWLDKKSNGAVHQGIMAYICSKLLYKEKDLFKLLIYQDMPLLLILDNILDPHNLGSCLRCADSSGVHLVIISRDKSVKLNSTVKKVASGSADIVPLIYVTNLIRILYILQKYNIYIIGTVIKSINYLYQTKLNKPLAFVMGSENNGIRFLTRKYCNEFISVPMLGVGLSLNVSIASAVCLFEAIRQRNKF